MCKNQTTTHFSRAIDFIPCQYHEGKGGKASYVWWSIRDPETGKMVRYKKMLDRKCYKTKAARLLAVQQIYANVWKEYVRGSHEPDDALPHTYREERLAMKAANAARKESVLLTDVLRMYKEHIEKEEQKGVKKQHTVTDYKMRLKVLLEYMKKKGKEKMACHGMTVAFCNEFLDYVLYERDTSIVNRNTHRQWLSALASWMVERNYIETNPISRIKKMKEPRKFREAIPPHELQRMTEYLGAHDRHFLLACMFEYYCFIRPRELVQIRVRDVSVKNQSVFVRAEVSKNRKDGFVALNDTILQLMLELGVLNAPNEFYLLGKGFQPSEKKSEYKIFGYRWKLLRQKMGWPKSYQFYSLKDSGIRDLANSAGAVTAKEQARHSSLEVTSLYTVSPEGHVNEDTKHFHGYL